jgi:hypothetical protein
MNKTEYKAAKTIYCQLAFNALPEVKATGKAYGKYVKFVVGYVLPNGDAYFVGMRSDGLYILNQCQSFSVVSSTPFRQVDWHMEGFSIIEKPYSRCQSNQLEMSRCGWCVTTISTI